jgi:DNA end-binding protein Ku
LLDTLHYEDEIREQDRPNLPKTIVNKKELDAAYSLIGALTEDFDPAQYQDEYRAALLELIDTKLEKKDPRALTAEPKAQKATGGDDLLEALRASLKAAKGASRNASARKTRTPTKAVAARKAAKSPTKKRAA